MASLENTNGEILGRIQTEKLLKKSKTKRDQVAKAGVLRCVKPPGDIQKLIKFSDYDHIVACLNFLEKTLKVTTL